MVKTLLAAVVLLLMLVVPAMAQDDFPRLQMGFGYANVTLPPFISTSTSHNSGFTSQFNFNILKSVGVDYYLGYYSLGNSTELLTNIFGGKLMYQGDKVVPYLVAGIGRGDFYISSGGYSQGLGGGAASRLGGGIDYKIGDAFYWRTEITKMQFHATGSWIGKANIATGVVFTIMQ